MEGQYLIYGSIIVLALVIVIVILYFIKKVELKYYKEKIKKRKTIREEVIPLF